MAAASVSNEDKTMGMLTHLLLIFTGFIGPLIIWLIKKDQSKFIDFHGRQALNFAFTILIAYAASAILIVVIIGLFLMPVVGIVGLVFAIIATIQANKGEWYTYPIAIPFFKMP